MRLFGADINPDTGLMEGGKLSIRRLSDMKGYFHDGESCSRMLENDPEVYRVYAIEQEERAGDLNFATTIIHPGKVGDEFFMTKGHYHAISDRSELYLCLRGKGMMLTQDRENKASWTEMRPMRMIYVPPHHAHRTVNTGEEDLIFLAVYPADAGHDYGEISETGFSALVVERDGDVRVIERDRL